MSDASTILTELLSNVPDTYQKTVGFPLYDILAAVSLRMEDTDTTLDESKAALDPENLSGADLDGYIYSRTGLTRHAATYAIGTVHITGNGTVSAGDLFESTSGIQFTADADTDIITEGDVSITCTTAGTVGNLAADSIAMMPVQLAGMTAVTNTSPTSEGYDEETDAAYLARFYTRIQTPPTSGNSYHYKSWALDITGVGGVQVYPLGHGTNTVDVVLIDSEGSPASETLVAEVQAYIDPDSGGIGAGEAPIGAHCYVSAATAVPLALVLTVSPAVGYEPETVTENIGAAVQTYLQGIAFQQDYASYAKIAEAILRADGVLDIADLTINGGTGNIAISDREVATVGEVTVTYE